jgi:hypothetical protein
MMAISKRIIQLRGEGTPQKSRRYFTKTITTIAISKAMMSPMRFILEGNVANGEPIKKPCAVLPLLVTINRGL